jgi:hypothetical protein
MLLNGLPLQISFNSLSYFFSRLPVILKYAQFDISKSLLAYDWKLWFFKFTLISIEIQAKIFHSITQLIDIPKIIFQAVVGSVTFTLSSINHKPFWYTYLSVDIFIIIYFIFDIIGLSWSRCYFLSVFYWLKSRKFLVHFFLYQLFERFKLKINLQLII